jgi:predicted DNA-binding protein with PD1-like motif
MKGTTLESRELTIGRTFGVTFEHGEEFFPAFAKFCEVNGVRQGYVPMLLAGFAEADIVGACEKLEDPEAPVWSKVQVSGVEALGGGTFTHDSDGALSPHIHVTVGEKARSANGYTSHLLSARVQFLTEMLVVEVLSPTMIRPRNPDLYNVPLLAFMDVPTA